MTDWPDVPVIPFREYDITARLTVSLTQLRQYPYLATDPRAWSVEDIVLARNLGVATIMIQNVTTRRARQ